MDSLLTLLLDHALSKDFTTVDPAMWTGLNTIDMLGLENSKGITTIPARAFSSIGNTVTVTITITDII